jgi:hypothetical protein
VNDPTVTDWMEAWGNTASALFSAFAFIAAVGLLWHEIRIRRADEVDRLAAQARMVLVSVLDARGESHSAARMLSVNVRNHSQAPIIDVEVRASRRKVDGAEDDVVEFYIEAIEGGQSDGDLWLLKTPVVLPRNSPTATHVDTEIQFTDAQGLRWVRVGRDQPQRQQS